MSSAGVRPSQRREPLDDFFVVFFLFLAGVRFVDALLARFLATVLRATPCFFEERVFLAVVPDLFFGEDFDFLDVPLPPLALAPPPDPRAGFGAASPTKGFGSLAACVVQSCRGSAKNMRRRWQLNFFWSK